MERARLRWIALAIVAAPTLAALLLCSRQGPAPSLRHERIVPVASETPDAPDAAPEAEVDPVDEADSYEQELRAELADVPPFGNDERRAVCGTRKECHVQRSVAVGTDSSGRAIRLVTALQWDAADPPKGGAGPRIAEHWAILTRAGTIVDRQLLFRDAAAYPDDSNLATARALASRLSVSGMRLSYPISYHGIGWRSTVYSTKHVVSLDGLLPLHAEEGMSWSGSQSLHFDVATATAVERRKLPACSFGPIAWPAATGESVPILWMDLDPALVRNWRTASLAPCVPSIDGVAVGFTLSGAADASDASFTAVARSAHEIFVEIIDDTVIRTGTETDSLDVWVSGFRGDPLGHCNTPLGTIETTQLRVRVADGAVVTIAGPPVPSIEVEVAPGPRVHLTMPDRFDFGSLALAYRDTDDGATVERVIATSRISTGAIGELGRVWKPPSALRCVLRDGRLERERLPRDPLRPIANAVHW